MTMFAGGHVVVTGAGPGLGAADVRGLAGAGARIVCVDIDPAVDAPGLIVAGAARSLHRRRGDLLRRRVALSALA